LKATKLARAEGQVNCGAQLSRDTPCRFGKDYVIGYSGHENGIALSLAAAVMGAKVIERHFTLDRTMKVHTMASVSHHMFLAT
jgi:hypothetical protein